MPVSATTPLRQAVGWIALAFVLTCGLSALLWFGSAVLEAVADSNASTARVMASGADLSAS